MKKILILSFIFISIHSFAQKSFFGVQAGINVANQRADNIILINGGGFNIYSPGPFFFGNTVKPNLGVFYHLNLSKIIGIRISAQNQGLGYKDKYDNRYDVNINYLTVPVSLYYYANRHMSLHVGSYLSFTENNTKVNKSGIQVPVTSVYHKNDFGFSIGAEHDLYKNFALDINYLIGIKNIWLDDAGGVKYTNRALQFTLIYKFKKIS